MQTSRYLSQPVPRQLHSVQLQAWARPEAYTLLKKLATLYKDLIIVNFKLMTVVDVEKVKYPPPVVEEESKDKEEEDSKDKEEGKEESKDKEEVSKDKEGESKDEAGEEGKMECEQPGEPATDLGTSSKMDDTTPKESDATSKESDATSKESDVTSKESDATPDGKEAMEVEKPKESEDSKTESKDKAETKKKATLKRKDSSDSEDEDEKKKKPETEEIKILKGANSFLTLTSRISRALSELFNQLVLLVGEPPPKPRLRQAPPAAPQYAETVELAKIIITLLMEFVREELPVISKGMIPAADDVSSSLFEQ